jgi:hypothetical protein
MGVYGKRPNSSAPECEGYVLVGVLVDPPAPPPAEGLEVPLLALPRCFHISPFSTSSFCALRARSCCSRTWFATGGTMLALAG